uniref:Peroxidase n=1 Tax=Chenopodium quinoa TaxID=63459 RepID=A0A803MHS3_CHEQI
MSTQELSAIGYDNKSPKFNGNNYAWWKNRIQNVIMGIDYECWLVVKNGPNIILKTDVEGNQVPKKDSELVTADYKLLEKNAKAMSILQQAIARAQMRSPQSNLQLNLLWGVRLAWEHPYFGFISMTALLMDVMVQFCSMTLQTLPENFKCYEVIDTIKSQVENLCPRVVSCADIVAIAARDSVVELGGPSWTVLLGRRDSTTASLSTANSDIPAPTLNINELIKSFSDKGFTTQEMVALFGAHTIRQARCTTFKTRIYNETNINSTFATSLQANCPQSGGDNNLSPLDKTSATTFDNAYYTNLMSQQGLLHSDQQLYNGNGTGTTDSQVSSYSSSSSTFLTDFSDAMVKMGNLSVLTGTNGEIRTICSKTN